MRRLVLVGLSGAALLTFATLSRAEPVSLDGEALRQLATGRTVHLQSPYGNLPVTFKADGTLSGTATGALAFYLGSGNDRGRWSVKGNRICQKFFKWFDGETHCLDVKQDGRRLVWRRDDGLSGTATVSADNSAPFEKPSALGVPKPIQRR